MIQSQNSTSYTKNKTAEITGTFFKLFGTARIILAEVQIKMILLFITVISKVEKKSGKKKLKNGALKFWKPWICKDEKNFDFSFRLLFEMISQLNSIHPYIRISDSTTSSFFFESNYCNLKCDCEWIKIPFLFLENSFANVSNSILHVQKWKSFWRLHPPFEKKKGRMKSGLQWLHSTLSSLSYVF